MCADGVAEGVALTFGWGWLWGLAAKESIAKGPRAKGFSEPASPPRMTPRASWSISPSMAIQRSQPGPHASSDPLARQIVSLDANPVFSAGGLRGEKPRSMLRDDARRHNLRSRRCAGRSKTSGLAIGRPGESRQNGNLPRDGDDGNLNAIMWLSRRHLCHLPASLTGSGGLTSKRAAAGRSQIARRGAREVAGEDQ